MTKHKYAVLDGMRGIAAIAVMMMHYTWDTKHQLFQSAYLAVDFFFMLSGFVIFHAYGKKLLSGEMKLKEFLIKRVIRLYPMFLLGLVIGTWWLAFSGLHSLRDIIGITLNNVFFIPSVAASNTDGIFPANDPSWSLFFELFVNLFVLQLFGLSKEQLLKAVKVILGVWVLYGAIEGIANDESAIFLFGGWDVRTFFVGFPRVFYGFMVGIFLYRLIENNGTLKTQLSGAWYAHPYILYVLMLEVFLFPYEAYGIYALIGVSVIAPVLLIIGANSQRHNFFSLPVSRFLGWVSYPVYCVHRPVYKLTKLALGKMHYSHMGGGLIAISIIGSFAVSILFCKYYEEPLRNWLTGKIYGKPKASEQKVWKIPYLPLPQESQA